MFQKQKYQDEAKGVLERKNEHTKLYAAATAELGKKMELPVVNLFESLQEEYGDCSDILEDGLHFTPKGQGAVWLRVKQPLLQSYPELEVRVQQGAP